MESPLVNPSTQAPHTYGKELILGENSGGSHLLGWLATEK